MENLGLFKPPQEMRELSLLQELEKNPVVSQRELSHKFGIALGVTNACLKRMVRRGWIRIRETSRRKVGYHITSKGFNEKSRLTNCFLSYTINIYSELKSIFEHKFKEMERKGIRRIAFYGVSDEMEVAYITLLKTNIELDGIVEDDENWRPIKIFGYELRKLDELIEMNPDAVLITSLKTDLEIKVKLLEDLMGLGKEYYTVFEGMNDLMDQRR